MASLANIFTRSTAGRGEQTATVSPSQRLERVIAAYAATIDAGADDLDWLSDKVKELLIPKIEAIEALVRSGGIGRFFGLLSEAVEVRRDKINQRNINLILGQVEAGPADRSNSEGGNLRAASVPK